MHRSPWSLVAAGMAFLLPVLFTPSLITPTWSGRFLATLVIAATGVGLLVVTLVARRDREVVLAAGVLAWATLSTALAKNPVLSFWGMFAWGTGLVYIAALVGSWLIGRRVDEDGRRLIATALLASAALTAALCLVEVMVDLSRVPELGLTDGRASGLFGNPVYAATFLAGAAWLAVTTIASRKVAGAALLALIAAGLQVTGSRAGLLVLGLACLASVLPLRRMAWIAVVAAGLGLAGGAAAGHIHGGATSTSRAVADGGSSGITPRVEMWAASGHAVADRPVVGSGPGRYLEATARYRTLRYIRSEGPRALYVEAHNLLVQYATTVGIPGALLLCAWLAAILRHRPMSPLWGFAVGVLLVEMLEPQHPSVGPLAFLALGAAGSTAPAAERAWQRALVGVTTAAGVAAAAVIGYGFFALDQARLDLTLGWSTRADTLLPWPEATEQVARSYILQAHEQRRPALLENALVFRRRTAAVDPGNPQLVVNLADFELQLQHREEAVRDFRRALAADPWSLPALNALGRLAAEDGDIATARRLLQRSLRADPAQTGTRRFLESLPTP